MKVKIIAVFHRKTKSLKIYRPYKSLFPIQYYNYIDMLLKSSPNCFCVLIAIFVLSTSCTNDSLSEPLETESTENPTEEEEPEVTTEETPEQVACDDPTNFIFNEKDGLLLVEFENAEFTEDWKLKSEGSTDSEVTFMVWEGEQSLGNPGNGIAT